MKKLKCSLTNCDQIPEINMTWLIHINGVDNKPQRNGGNFCGSCASMIYEKIALIPNVVSSIICADPK
jgi:hypothetical protein